MRQVRAKALRRIARRATVGQPDKQYLKHIRSGGIRLSDNCTRGFYQKLKREAR